MLESAETARKTGLQEALLKWFESEKRDFPWRHTTNPFKILVAEKLLQQTRATAAVVQTYHELVASYPTPSALARAPLSDLERIIRPLGLVFRAKQLRAMAEELVARHAGAVPSSYTELMELTGVGEYCALAVLSFAFGEDVPVVDTNVGRFLYRLYDIRQPFPANPSRKRWLHEVAAKLVPPGRSRAFNLAVLDLCAEVCTKPDPKCGACPVQEFCQYGMREMAATGPESES